jgi:SAM-dependent methyltransferase
MLTETQRAFDSVADTYDGPRGNNALVQRMRECTWRTVEELVPAGGRLLDIGCGTGLDARHFADLQYRVVATDWSPLMVERTARRAAECGLSERISALRVGAQELGRISDRFDGIYSNMGPLNCVPNLPEISRQCRRLLRRGGSLVVTVIGRVCPWELFHYGARLQVRRLLVRYARGMAAVRLNQHRLWARYYTPRQFYRHFALEFSLTRYRALGLLVPPPYLLGVRERAPRLVAALARIEECVGEWPLLRDAGDHFLMVLTAK